MEKKYTKVAEIGHDDDGKPVVKIEDEKSFVLTMANYISEEFVNNNDKPMNILLGITGHTIARFSRGFLTQYKNNLDEFVTSQAKIYDEIKKQIFKERSMN